MTDRPTAKEIEEQAKPPRRLRMFVNCVHGPEGTCCWECHLAYLLHSIAVEKNELRDLCGRMAGWIESEGELHPIAQALLAERDKLEGLTKEPADE